MTDSFVTQCPHCQTSFRVSHSQLAVARGVVRCGACLQVFNAAQQLLDEQLAAAAAQVPDADAPIDLTLDHETPPAHSRRLDEPELDFSLDLDHEPELEPAPQPEPEPEPQPEKAAAPEPAATPEPSPAPPKPRPEPLWIHDDLDLDSLDLDEELAKLEEQELQLSRQVLARQQLPVAPQRHFGASRDSVEDESWAEALLNDDLDEPPEQPAAEPPKDSPPLPDDNPALFTRLAVDRRKAPLLDLPPLDERTEPSFSESTFSLEEPPEEEPVAEDLSDPRQGLTRKTRTTPPRARREQRADEHEAILGEWSAIDEPGPDDDRAESELADPVQAMPVPDLRARNEPAVKDEALFNLYEDPLLLDWQERRSPWGRRLLWSLLILLAAGGLGAQYVWYHFDELSRQDEYRPWFQELCPEIGCSVPSKVDISLIRSSNLVVRSHPEFAGALVVDAILYNRAPFSQPFPLLELRFADSNGHLIASRRFKPSEYLSGELAGQDEMPPQTPIHIALDILDPGPKAVNYSLSFHSPE